MNTWKQLISERESEIVRWAFMHEQFRKDLVENPREVLETELGVRFPAGATIRVFEDGERRIHLVVPCSKPAGEHGTQKRSHDQLISRAVNDADFRADLLASPKTAIERGLGVELPEDLEIIVWEEKEDSYAITLPWNREAGVMRVENEMDREFLSSFSGEVPLVEHIACEPHPATGSIKRRPYQATDTAAYSGCCCGILTISSCI